MGFFETEQEKQKRVRMEKIMATKQDTEKRPSPIGDAKFEDLDWLDFKVQQEKKTIKLKTYRMSPDPKNVQDTKAIIIMFHGLNSHQGNGAHIAKGIVQTGVTYVGFDFRGFGQSEGIPGYVESEEQHLADCEQFINLVENYYPNKKIFISGQSMGGMTAFLLGLKFPKRFAGSVLFCPSIKDQKLNAKVGKQLAKFVGWIAPKMETVPQSHGMANSNPQISINNENDPYIYKGKVIPGTIRFLLNTMDKCEHLFKNYQVPFLLIQGGIDKLVDPDLGQELLEQAPVQDKQLIFKEDMWHNIWMEDHIHEIIPRISEWLHKRI